MLNTEGAFVTVISDERTLEAMLPQWSDLAVNSVEDCAYYAPHFALPLFRTLAAEGSICFVAAWVGSRLAAFLPVAPGRLNIPGLVPAGMAWQSDYTFSCTPLLDKEDPVRAARALISGLSKLGRGEWILPDLNVEGPACQALLAALDEIGAPHLFRGGYDRAALETGPSFDEHMQTHVESKRRRELARSRRRFEELGKVEFRSATYGDDLRAAAQSFLELEASGWKGKRGTALACNGDTRRFAELAFGEAAEQGKVRIDQLLLDGKPVAAGVTVLAGRTGFTVKGAFDETYAAHSVGLLLEVEVLRDVLTSRWADRLDSATNGSHVIDRLWPARTKVADLVVSLADSAAAPRLGMLASTMKWKQNAKSLIRPYLEKLRAA